MIWVTRNFVHVDRVACPWLIRRFIDREAEFLFVPANNVEKVAKVVGGIPFDIQGVELGHKGNECSFDAIIGKYKLTEPALHDLAEVVRAADTAGEDVNSIAPGLEAIATGTPLINANDHDALQQQMVVYDALLSFFRYKRLIAQYMSETENMTRAERKVFYQEHYGISVEAKMIDKQQD